jgi:hypothetical protein
VEDFPPNSYTSKDPEKSSARREELPKKIEKVVVGEVVQRKKPFGRRVKEAFIVGDSQTIWNYIATEVVVPAAKDLIADSAVSFVDRLLFGEGGGYSRRPRSGRYRQDSDKYTNYSRQTARTERRRPPWEPERQQRSRRLPQVHEFQEIILETRAECEEVIEQMFNLVEKYDVATVSDLYDLIGVESNYMDDKWGWSSLRHFEIRRVRDGYLLDIPRPEPINR